MLLIGYVTRVTKQGTPQFFVPFSGRKILQEILPMPSGVSPKLTPLPVPIRPSSPRQSFFQSLLHRESFCAWIFIAPALLGFTVFYLLPTFRAIYISFTDWNLLRAPHLNAGINYIKLWNDPNFWNSMKITLA